MITLTAWAQQPSPSPGAVETEKALRARVEQFYQLQVDKKYHQAEAFVAEDTQDLFVGSSKPDLQGFSIQKVELLDGNTKANVTIKAKSTMAIMGTRMPFESAAPTSWKLESGQWVWYLDPQAVIHTPFGEIKPTGTATAGAKLSAFSAIKPDLEAIKHQVTLSQTSVALSAEKPMATIVISNAMPGPVDVSIENRIPGVKVEIENSHLEPKSNGTLRFAKVGQGRSAGVIHVTVSPLNTLLDVQVTSE